VTSAVPRLAAIDQFRAPRVAPATHTRRFLSHPAPSGYPSTPMTRYHVLADAGDLADDLRSLGLHDAASAHEALVRCLAQLDGDRAGDHEAALRDPELAELPRR
jgi:hypothetical protein